MSSFFPFAGNDIHSFFTNTVEGLALLVPNTCSELRRGVTPVMKNGNAIVPSDCIKLTAKGKAERELDGVDTSLEVYLMPSERTKKVRKFKTE